MAWTKIQFLDHRAYFMLISHVIIFSGRHVAAVEDARSSPALADILPASPLPGVLWSEYQPRVMLAISKTILEMPMDPILLQSEFSSFDGDGLPGTQEEFKIEIAPAKEECFFQWMKVGTRLHTSFQVLRGADKNLDFSLRDPTGIISHIHPWTSNGNINTTIDKEGVYVLCLGNNMSKFSRKLVLVFFQTEHAEEWRNYTQGIVEYETDILAMRKSLQTVQTRVSTAKVTQAMVRMHLTKDLYNLGRLSTTIQQRSLVVCSVILVVAIFQVYLVRRLFRTSRVTATSKPRA